MPSYNRKRGIVRYSDTGSGYKSLGQQSWAIDTTQFFGTDYKANSVGATRDLVDGALVTRADSLFAGPDNQAGAFYAVRGDTAISGKKYWEYSASLIQGDVRPSIANTSLSTESDLFGTSANAVSLFLSNPLYRTNNTNTVVSAFSEGDVINWACDGATGEVWLGVNGTWYNSGDPAAGTGEVATISGTIYPFFLWTSGAGVLQLFTELQYAPPTGFTAL